MCLVFKSRGVVLAVHAVDAWNWSRRCFSGPHRWRGRKKEKKQTYVIIFKIQDKRETAARFVCRREFFFQSEVARWEAGWVIRFFVLSSSYLYFLCTSSVFFPSSFETSLDRSKVFVQNLRNSEIDVKSFQILFVTILCCWVLPFHLFPFRKIFSMKLTKENCRDPIEKSRQKSS